MIKDYSLIDNFIIYICTDGNTVLEWEDGSVNLMQGETILIPAVMERIDIKPLMASKILEVYIR